jgi:hypothetical protein
MKKGIASFDMDMTLLDHKDYKIPESAFRALDKLRENYYIVISTGRDMDAKYCSGLMDGVNPDAVIHLNGTKITVGDEMIYEHRMDPELVKRILHYTEGKSFAMGITIGAEDFFMNPEYVVKQDMIRWHTSDRCFRDPWKLLESPVRTLCYIGPDFWVPQIEADFPMLKLPLFSARTGADVVERSASKANGLHRLCEYFHVDIKDTVAFGDSMNDYEIVRAAGIGVAMGNGFPELKKAADYVTTAIGDDGVWNACVNLKLIQPD